MDRSYRIISADSHLEGAGLDEWPLRVPEKHRHRAPRRVWLPDGGYVLGMEGQPFSGKAMGVFSGHSPEEYRPEEPREETDPGSGPPEQRVREQDQDGVDAEILFTGVGGPSHWLGIKTDEAYLAVLRAYNDWLAEDYCSVAPDRLLGLGVIPQRGGVDVAVAELEHCAKMGLKGVFLAAFPSGETRYPLPEDDKFWAAALDLNMPLAVHVSFGGGHPPLVLRYPKQPTGDDDIRDHPMNRMARYAYGGGVHAVQLILAGVFDRFPNLKLFFAETMTGWIPNFYDFMDYDYKTTKYWMERMFGIKRLDRPPSEYIKEHCYWGFWYNPAGIQARETIGVDHMLWGSDFPHIVSAWPHSMELLDDQLKGVAEEEKRKMVSENAIKFFHLDAA